LFSLQKEMCEDMVKVVDYDATWIEDFKLLRNIYVNSLEDHLLRVEHVGSTAVPGLCAKPKIDIDLIIEDYSCFPEVIDELDELGYEYQGDFGIEGRESFKRKDEIVPWNGISSVKPPHNLYVCPEDSRELERHLAFRDHLREDDRTRKRYAELKRRLAVEHRDDREAYTEGKTKFIERVLQKIM